MLKGLDAGIATQDNIAWLKTREYKYIVVSRKPNRVMPEGKVPVVVNTNAVQGEDALIKNDATDEPELYCHSQAKEARTKQRTGKAEARFELEKLAQGLYKKGYTKKYEKIVERAGRLKEKYSSVGESDGISIAADNEKKSQKTTSLEFIALGQTS